MKIDYVTCDVFTHQAFGGNPLAVIPDAHGLSSAQMQRIAREFNYSETTFVLPPQDRANTAEVRIFTPMAELPFAGHPNVGTAVALARMGRGVGVDEFRFEEKAGLVRVALERQNGEVVGATLTSPVIPTIGDEVDTASLAASMSIPPSAIATSRHKPLLVTAGIVFAIAELADLDSLAQAQPGIYANADGILVYTRLNGGNQGADIRARMFAPKHNIPEDPATGSAMVALAGLLGGLGKNDGDYHWTVDQGIEMGRPSRLHVMAERRDGRVTRITVGGGAIMMMSGFLQWGS